MYCRNCGGAMNDNQAVCLKCGVETGTGNSFCPNCGNAVNPEAVFCVNCGISLKKEENKNNGNLAGIKKRSIVTCILLSIVTCGIYGIYWFVTLTNDMNRASGNEKDTSGGKAFLFSLITCGIYEFYWAYRLGVKRDQLANEKGSSGILYLILMIFGLGIVAQCMAQDAVNKAVEGNM